MEAENWTQAVRVRSVNFTSALCLPSFYASSFWLSVKRKRAPQSRFRFPFWRIQKADGSDCKEPTTRIWLEIDRVKARDQKLGPMMSLCFLTPFLIQRGCIRVRLTDSAARILPWFLSLNPSHTQLSKFVALWERVHVAGFEGRRRRWKKPHRRRFKPTTSVSRATVCCQRACA